ncbi:kelch motif-containing protein [Geobacillus icigianus]|uniref:Uncharacterized protein n=1 Tax=Geobacillus subterraneus TaxID=129338 RepID=A0A679G1X0_9BACL|nr:MULTISPECIES: kelch motif-containing protein [Geobacillus]KYD24206.1 hypothetical protein B4113_2590 [Geobacillus sp. B4113_201601]BBW98001.1 hypothetical protein GsuE55_28340 [Geobacillus subterraneus]
MKPASHAKGKNEQTLLAGYNIIDAVVVKNRIYVAIETNGIYTIRIFDPSTSSWTTMGSTKNEITSIAPSPYDNQIAVTIATENGKKYRFSATDAGSI